MSKCLMMNGRKMNLFAAGITVGKSATNLDFSILNVKQSCAKHDPH